MYVLLLFCHVLLIYIVKFYFSTLVIEHNFEKNEK